MKEKFHSSPARDDSQRSAASSSVFNNSDRIFKEARLGWRRPRVWLPLLAVLYLAASLCLSTNETQAGRREARQQWMAPATEAQRKNPVPVNDSSLAAGRKIFLNHC